MILAKTLLLINLIGYLLNKFEMSPNQNNPFFKVSGLILKEIKIIISFLIFASFVSQLESLLIFIILVLAEHVLFRTMLPNQLKKISIVFTIISLNPIFYIKLTSKKGSILFVWSEVFKRLLKPVVKICDKQIKKNSKGFKGVSLIVLGTGGVYLSAKTGMAASNFYLDNWHLSPVQENLEIWKIEKLDWDLRLKYLEKNGSVTDDFQKEHLEFSKKGVELQKEVSSWQKKSGLKKKLIIDINTSLFYVYILLD